MATICDDITPELVAYLDGELDEVARRPIAAHLSTCLGCRREIEQLTTVRRWIGDRPSVEPSGEFAADFWRRLEREGGPSTRGRAWWWAAPALAAAAVVALALRSFVPSAVEPSPRPAERAAAPAAPVAAPAANVANAKPAAPPAAEQVAEAPELAPEDLPPELLEHPELFLRLPVVRRLEKLEHFDEVRQMQQDDTAGGEEGRG
jgi:anti-sigma factor RsiW